MTIYMQFPDKSVIVGFTNGFRKNAPGLSNEAMIQNLRDLGIIDKIPLILQGELAHCIKPEDHANIILHIDTHRIPGKYLDMVEVADRATDTAIKNGFKTIYIMAYPIFGWHWGWYQVRKRTRRFGIKTHILWRVWKIPDDPHSEQWWTRHFLYQFLYPPYKLFKKFFFK